MNVAQWLLALGGVDIHMLHDDAFLETCCNGHLETAQWLFSLGGVDIHALGDDAFQWTCKGGHLETAQWLLSLGGVDIHTEHDNAFRRACYGGHLETARWLVGLGGVDIHVKEDYAFILVTRYSFECGDEDFTKLGRWLIDQDPHYEWPEYFVSMLQTWSSARDAWIKAVVWSTRGG